MPQQQNSAVGLMFLLFLLWVVFPDGEYRAQSLIQSDLAAERLSRFRDALDVLNQSKWGDFAPSQTEGGENGGEGTYLNLTGFRREDKFAWEDLSHFRETGLQLSHYAMSSSAATEQPWDFGQGDPVWTNASGTLRGEWVRKQGSISRGYDSYNLSESVPSMNWIGDKVEWARNMTGDSGRMVLTVEGNNTLTEYEQLSTQSAPLAGGSIRNVKGTVTIEDTAGSGLDWEMRVWGAHWPRQGVMLLTTTSEKFEGIFGLPHLTASADYFQSSQLLLNQTIAQTLAKKEKNVFFDQNVPYSSEIENPTYTTHPSPHCEFVLYAQIHPPTKEDFSLKESDAEKETIANIIQAIESELASPEGAPLPRPPDLHMSAVVYSPDCGFFLETKGPPTFPPGESQHLTGTKKEVHLHTVKSWLLVYAVVVLAQVYLLKNQLRESYTPSTMARVSFGTASIIVIVDGMTFTAAATWVSSAASTFLPTLALMFASFLSMTIGGSFLAKIHEVQLPEGRNRRERDTAASGATSTTETSSAPSPAPRPSDTGSLLPAPVTAPRPTIPQPIIVPSDQDIDAEIADAAASVPISGRAQPQPGRTQQTQQQLAPPTAAQSFQAIIGRYILLSLGISFLTISSTTWYPSVRSAFLNLCIFIYLSLWIPQIHRNIMRNCRRALRWQFVVGQSVLRLLPVAYFWVKSDNFLYARTDRRAFAVFCGWLWLQIVILAAQDIVGPRFGIPASWTPEAWDYHPVLREDNLEAGGLPIGLVAEDHPGLERTSGEDGRDKKRGSDTRHIDCAICREDLGVPVIRAGEEPTSVAGAFARRMYMVTPCRHIFHTACLEGWMRFRLQCPICREELPPL